MYITDGYNAYKWDGFDFKGKKSKLSTLNSREGKFAPSLGGLYF